MLKIEKVENVELSRMFERKYDAERLRLGSEDAVNHQRCYHLSSAGWGTLCETGLDVKQAKPGLFGRALYFSPDAQKCDGYWRKATGGDAGAVAVASTGHDPSTTRVMFACRVLLGQTYEFAPSQTCKGMTKPPDGHESVSGLIRGDREVAVYENERALLEYMITYQVRKQAYPQIQMPP